MPYLLCILSLPGLAASYALFHCCFRYGELINSILHGKAFARSSYGCADLEDSTLWELITQYSPSCYVDSSFYLHFSPDRLHPPSTPSFLVYQAHYLPVPSPVIQVSDTYRKQQLSSEKQIYLNLQKSNWWTWLVSTQRIIPSIYCVKMPTCFLAPSPSKSRSRSYEIGNESAWRGMIG